ncbi:hypothetical protein AMECASPLE_010571 [Ameca splendens]|uniref:Uncharacterized protein n=1 Tax=Ameca splendens TaxID=208324 RepID=A0ABV0YBN5_9TELE
MCQLLSALLSYENRCLDTEKEGVKIIVEGEYRWGTNSSVSFVLFFLAVTGDESGRHRVVAQQGRSQSALKLVQCSPGLATMMEKAAVLLLLFCCLVMSLSGSPLYPSISYELNIYPTGSSTRCFQLTLIIIIFLTLPGDDKLVALLSSVELQPLGAQL